MWKCPGIAKLFRHYNTLGTNLHDINTIKAYVTRIIGILESAMTGIALIYPH